MAMISLRQSAKMMSKPCFGSPTDADWPFLSALDNPPRQWNDSVHSRSLILGVTPVLRLIRLWNILPKVANCR